MRKQFNKGDIVDVNAHTTLARWAEAKYLGTTTSAGKRRHAVVMLFADGSEGYRLEVPSRRIREHHTPQRQEITDMRATALARATELRTLASDIERAAETIACIARNDMRSTSVDRPSWERAEKVLRDAGISVRHSSFYTWLT